jgi:hypothetical protein
MGRKPTEEEITLDGDDTKAPLYRKVLAQLPISS